MEFEGSHGCLRGGSLQSGVPLLRKVCRYLPRNTCLPRVTSALSAYGIRFTRVRRVASSRAEFLTYAANFVIIPRREPFVPDRCRKGGRESRAARSIDYARLLLSPEIAREPHRGGARRTREARRSFSPVDSREDRFHSPSLSKARNVNRGKAPLIIPSNVTLRYGNSREVCPSV